MLIDTHCHFDFKPFSLDYEKYYHNLKSEGVNKIIVPSVGPSNWDTVVYLSNRFPGIFFQLGIHPCYVSSLSQQDLETFEYYVNKHISNPKFFGIGEIGLDFFKQTNKTKQIEFLNFQLHIAIKYSLNIVLHSRKAHNDLVRLLKQKKQKISGIIHAFTGSLHQAQEFIDLGLKIGVGGVITYERAKKTRETISSIPLRSIVLETDSPFMPIFGEQGKANTPENIKKILDEICLLRNESKEEITSQISKNTLSLIT